MSGRGHGKGQGKGRGKGRGAGSTAVVKPGHISEDLDAAAKDASSTDVGLNPSGSKRKLSPLPTDRVTRRSTRKLKPIKPDPDNGEIKVPTCAPRKKAPAPALSGM